MQIEILNSLMQAHDRWVRQREVLTYRISDSRIGYVHIDQMNTANYQKFVSRSFGTYALREAFVIDVRFNVGGNLANRPTVTPSGLEETNTPIEMDVTGIITRTEVADINADGSPELYVFGFDGTSQTVFAWSANRKKSLSEISLPDLNAAQSKGYRGGDEYSVVEGILGRRFPIHQEQPPEKPTGKVRQIQYKLHPGEAGWQMKVDQVVEF